MTADLYLRLPAEPPVGRVGSRAGVVTDLRRTTDVAADRRAHQARAAEVAGFAGVVVPFDPEGDDPLVAATALAAVTRRIRIFAGVPTSLAGPVYLAKLAVTFQRFSGDRLGWWIATGPDGAGAGRSFGDPLTGAAAHARDAELLAVARRVHAGEAVDHAGTHFSVVGGGFAPPLAGRPFPPVAVTGSAPAAADLAVAHGDHIVLTSTDPAGVGSQVADLRRRAEPAGRTVTPFVELAVVARDDADEARAVAARARRRRRPGTRRARSSGSSVATPTSPTTSLGCTPRASRPSSSGWTPPSTRPTASVTTCARCSRPVPPRRPTVSPDPTTIDVYWRLPSHGDPASVRDATLVRGDWTPTTAASLAPGRGAGRVDEVSYVEHLGDIARAAEASGFVGALIPSFPPTDDPWVISAALAGRTSTFRFMVAFQPGFLNPVHTAHLSASLQRLTGGRLVYNVITGGGGPDQGWWGDLVAHDERYSRTQEFLDVLRGVWGTTPVDHDGRHYSVQGGNLAAPLAAQPFPEIYLSGSSDAAIDAAGAHADHYLSWLEPFDTLAAKFERVRGPRGRHRPQPALRGAPRRARPPHPRRGVVRGAARVRRRRSERPAAVGPGHRRRLGGGGPPGGVPPRSAHPGRRPAGGAERLGGIPPVASRAPPSASSATTPPSPSGSTTSSPSGWTPSSSPACRTSKRRSVSAKRCSRC